MSRRRAPWVQPPEYSRLDRMHGWGEPLPEPTPMRRKPRRPAPAWLECIYIFVFMSTTLLIFYAAYTWL